METTIVNDELYEMFRDEEGQNPEMIDFVSGSVIRIPADGSERCDRNIYLTYDGLDFNADIVRDKSEELIAVLPGYLE